MSLLSVIADNSTVIYAVCLPGLVLSAGYIGWKATAGGGLSETATPPPTPVRPAQRRPVPPPVPTTKLRSVELGQAEHQARGEAKTAKLAPVAPAPAPAATAKPSRTPTAEELDDEAKDSLFSGLGDDAETEKVPEVSHMRKAERMEELGFHKQAQQASNDGRPITESAKAESKPAPETKPLAETKPASDAKRAETRELSATAPASVTPAPRTQTQELDDILSRIDKVLAENPVMATMTLGSNSTDQQTPVKPVPPKPPVPPTPPGGGDKKPDPGDQQRLF